MRQTYGFSHRPVGRAEFLQYKKPSWTALFPDIGKSSVERLHDVDAR